MASIEIDLELGKALLKGAAIATAEYLRRLPRRTDPDGSEWVDAELLEELAKKLETL